MLKLQFSAVRFVKYSIPVKDYMPRANTFIGETTSASAIDTLPSLLVSKFS